MASPGIGERPRADGVTCVVRGARRQQTVLVDPGTHEALLTSSVKRPPRVLSGYTSDRFAWAKVRPTGIFLGMAPQGTGFGRLSQHGTMASVGGVSPRVIATLGGSGSTVGAVTTNSSLVYDCQVSQIMSEALAGMMSDGSTIGWATGRCTGGGTETWRRGALRFRPQGQWWHPVVSWTAIFSDGTATCGLCC